MHPGLAVLIATLLPLVALVGGLQPTSVAAQTEGPVITDIWLAEGQTDPRHREKFEYGKTPPETIYVVVTFNENIKLRGNTPRPTLTLTIGKWQREAAYDVQTLDNELRFSYRVVPGDEGPISVGANALRDNGNTIFLKGKGGTEEEHEANQAILDHSARPLGHRVGGPTKVRNLKVEPAGSGKLRVTWTEASYAPKGYRLSYREGKPGSGLLRWPVAVSGTVITGLTDGQKYVIRVDTLDDDGEAVGATTAVNDYGTPPGAPTKPRNLQVTPAGSGKLKVTWTPAINAPYEAPGKDRYRVFYRDSETDVQTQLKNTIIVETPTAVSTVISDLKDRTRYTIRVDTLDVAGNAVNATAVYAPGTPGIPTKVTNLQVTPAGDGELKVTWTAASYAPRGYLLFYRENEQGSVERRWRPAVSGEVITGLTNGQEYEIRVETLDTGKKTDEANPSVAATGSPKQSPARVSNFSVAATDNGELTVTWTTSYAPHGYRLRWRKIDGGFNEGVRLPAGTTEYEITTGLEAGTVYRVRIDSLNEDGGLVSGTAFAKDARTRTNVPSPPQELTLTTKKDDPQLDPGEIEVTWKAATNAPNGYMVRWRQSGTTTFIGSSRPEQGTSHTIRNLVMGTKYIVRVDTLDSNGNVVAGVFASASIRVERSLTALTITAVKLITGKFDASPYGVGVYGPGDTIWVSVTFSEVVALDPVILEQVRPTFTLMIGNRERQATWQGQFNGNEIRFGYKVVAQDAGEIRFRENSLRSNDYTIHKMGEANAEAVLTYTGGLKPGRWVAPPVRGLVARAGDESLGVSWDVPQSTRWQYLVRWRERRAGSELSEGETVPGTSYTITGLVNGQTYVVRVDTLDADGNRIHGTNVAVAATPQEAGTPPTEPRELELVMGSAEGTIDVTWQPAETAPSGYLVSWHESGSTGFKQAVLVHVGTQYTITDLTVGTTYIVRVDTLDRNASDIHGASMSKSLTLTEPPDPPPGPTVEFVKIDVQAAEGTTLNFEVKLSGAPDHEVRVRWRTKKGTAQTDDFEAGMGDLVFAPGDTIKPIKVNTKKDAIDDPDETFTVELFNARGAELGKNTEAKGTITNSDPMPAVWLAYFGRAVAEQALDGIVWRIGTVRRASWEATLGGVPVGSATAVAGEAGIGHADLLSAFDDTDHKSRGDREPDAITLTDFLATSSFAVADTEDGAGHGVAFWGRGARSSFGGTDGTANVDGTLTAAMLGADYGNDGWRAGVAVSGTEGKGSYRVAREGAGRMRVSLVSAIPYLSVTPSERLSLWAAAGTGTGTMTLTPEDASPAETDIDWLMAAAGLRGELLAEGSGPALALLSDVLWSRTTSDRADASGTSTSLASSSVATSRVRLGLEGSWTLPQGLMPKLELGVRYDDGDAGSGFGVELGGGLTWSVPNSGLHFDVSGRTLLAAGDGRRGNSGFSATLGYDSRPDSALGLSLSLSRDVGGASSGGLAALFAPDMPWSGDDGEPARWAFEASYGLPAFCGRCTTSTTVGYSTFDGGRSYSLGWRLEPVANAEGTSDLSFGLRATRRETAGVPTDHGIEAVFQYRW